MSEEKGELVLGFYRDEEGDIFFSGEEKLDVKGWLKVMTSAAQFLSFGFYMMKLSLSRGKVDRMICQMVECIYEIVNLDDEGEEK